MSQPGRRVRAFAGRSIHWIDRLIPLTQHTVLGALSRHIGAANGVSVARLVDEITGAPPTAGLERQVRDVIVALRLAGLHVCAHPSTGYYIAADAQELDRTCRFLVDRAMTGLSQVSRMKRVSMPDLYGQLRIKT